MPNSRSSHSDTTELIEFAREPSISVLPHDILITTFEFVSDVKTLFNACLVCKAFDDAANKILWQRVTEDPLRPKVCTPLLTAIYLFNDELLTRRTRQLVPTERTRSHLVRSLLWDSADTYNKSILRSTSYLFS